MKTLNKITGLKLEEIAKFDSEKFSSCIVRYNGEVGGNAFEKEITIEQVLALHKSLTGSKNKEIVLTCSKELFLYNDGDPYANIIARVSEYDLVRKEG